MHLRICCLWHALWFLRLAALLIWDVWCLFKLSRCWFVVFQLVAGQGLQLQRADSVTVCNEFGLVYRGVGQLATAS